MTKRRMKVTTRHTGKSNPAVARRSSSGTWTLAIVALLVLIGLVGCLLVSRPDPTNAASTQQSSNVRAPDPGGTSPAPPTAAAEAPAGNAVCTINYSLKQAGQVSAAVYRDGRLVRELMRGKPHKPGDYTIAWDGLDRYGKPQPAGDYEWRLLRTPGFQAEYITSIGTNPDSARYDNWVGNHGGAASVAVDRTGVYTAAGVTETAPVLLKQSLDGKTRHWTRGRGDVTNGRFQGGNSLAVDGRGKLYMLQQNGYIQVIDTKEGKLTFSKYHRDKIWDVLPDDKKGKGGKRGMFIYRHGREVAGLDLAAHGKTIVVSDHEHNQVHWLSQKDGSKLHTVNVPQPWGVAVDTTESVYVISRTSVLQIKPKLKPRVVIAKNLSTPRRLAYDSSSRTFLVVERGDLQQIKRFDLQGKLLQTYGRKGGRRTGIYVPTDFRDVTDIAADGKGGFLVAEPGAAPRRLAHFDRNGKLINEWYGGQPYYAWAEPDPQDPSLVWFNPGSWLALAKIDYNTGDWEVLETYNLNDLGTRLVRAVAGHRGRWLVRYHNGKRYLITQEGPPQVLLHNKGVLQPLTAFGRGNDLKRVPAYAGKVNRETKGFRWIDSNRDGKAQDDEVLIINQDGRLPGAGWVAEDMTLVSYYGTEEDSETYYTVSTTTPTWRGDIPVYPAGKETGGSRRVGKTVSWTKPSHRGSGIYSDRDGNVYGNFLGGPECHGAGWPTDWGHRARFVKWDRTGKECWKVGRHAYRGGLAGRGQTPPGQLHVPMFGIGETEETIVLADRVETLAMAWTKEDGLYAGSFFDRRRDDGLPDKVYHWWRTPNGKEAITTSDNAQGGRVVQGPDGAVYWFVQGRNSVPVYRIHGWDDWTRQSGKITITTTPPHAKAQGTGLHAAYFNSTTIGRTPKTSRVDRQVWHGFPRKVNRKLSHNIVDGFQHGPTYDWSKEIKPLQTAPGKFAVRWSGYVEAPISEAFIFSVYTRGGMRLWVDGKQRIFSWNETVGRRETEAIPLQAGKRYPICLEFYSTHKRPACSLNWESMNTDRERIPTRFLYPDAAVKPAVSPDARAATAKIPANTFDAQSGQITAKEVRGGKVSGLRQRAFGITGAWVKYERIDFGTGVKQLKAGASGQAAGKASFPVTLEWRLDTPDGKPIAKAAMTEGAGNPTVPVARTVTGIHDVYVINTSPKKWHFVNFYWFAFD